MDQMGELMRGHRSSLNRLGDKTVVPLFANDHLIRFGGFQLVFRAENGLEVFHYPFADTLTMQAQWSSATAPRFRFFEQIRR